MLKKTIYITNPYYLRYKNRQMVLQGKGKEEVRTVPVEDIGFVVIEHPQVIITMPLLAALNANNVAVIFCDEKHMPTSMLLNLDGHHLQNEIFRQQIDASVPLKKNLWKQTVTAKISNQGALLKKLNKPYGELVSLAREVKSGDTSNREGIAARLYWKYLFGDEFNRERYGAFPNALLNYGYILLRSAVARSLTGSGLLPTLGIHHHNKYNAFCLADDIMEPYRPYVDEIVYLIKDKKRDDNLTKEDKTELLQVLTADVAIGKNKRPLMIALAQTTASLARCFAGGEQRHVSYPLF